MWVRPLPLCTCCSLELCRAGDSPDPPLPALQKHLCWARCPSGCKTSQRGGRRGAPSTTGGARCVQSTGHQPNQPGSRKAESEWASVFSRNVKARGLRRTRCCSSARGRVMHLSHPATAPGPGSMRLQQPKKRDRAEGSLLKTGLLRKRSFSFALSSGDGPCEGRATPRRKLVGTVPLSSSGEPEGERGRALGPAEVDTARCRQSGGVEASGGCGGLLSHRLHSSRRY